VLMWCEATGEVRQFASVFCREVYEWLREYISNSEGGENGKV
jgi:hypothetical protein